MSRILHDDGVSLRQPMALPKLGTHLLVSILYTFLVLVPKLASAEQKLAQPDYSVYLKKNELLKRVEDLVLAHPDIMKLELRHAQDGDYKADLQVVTLEPGGLSPSHTTKARLLIDFGEHGREYISSEVGLRFLQVVSDPGLLEQYTGSSRRLARIQAILKNCVFKILPMENVNGRELVEGGQLCERKNGRGVDTNRNFDIDWGKKEKDYDPREEFPGKAPHSEPEVQIILALAKELQPHTWLNVHSGMYALFTPYDHKASVPNTTDARAALRMLHRIKELSCPKCVVGSGGHSVGYLAHGTGTDYMFEKLGVPMSFTWEIYGDESATFEDCFRMFNPLTKEEFERVVTLWVKALLQLVELLPSHPAAAPLFRHIGLDKSEGDQGAVAPGSVTTSDDAAQQRQEGTAAAASPAASSSSSKDEAAVVDKQGDNQQDKQQQDKQQKDIKEQDSDQYAAAVSSDKPPKAATGSSSTPAAAGSTEADDQQLEEQIQVYHRIPPASGHVSEDSLLRLGAFHSKRVIPLLIGLAGMGVLLYYATRTPDGLPVYSKVTARGRDL